MAKHTIFLLLVSLTAAKKEAQVYISEAPEPIYLDEADINEI
jgi:hypothetical protein